MTLQVNASDADTGENSRLRYELLPTPGFHEFAIDRVTGLISAVASFDRERITKYRLQVCLKNTPAIT